MEKVINWLSNNLDKVTHFAVSIVLTIVIGAILFHTSVGLPILNAATAGALAALALGFIKEVVDFMRGGKFDAKDIVADFIGSAVGLAILCLI